MINNDLIYDRYKRILWKFQHLSDNVAEWYMFFFIFHSCIRRKTFNTPINFFKNVCAFVKECWTWNISWKNFRKSSVTLFVSWTFIFSVLIRKKIQFCLTKSNWKQIGMTLSCNFYHFLLQLQMLISIDLSSNWIPYHTILLAWFHDIWELYIIELLWKW